MRRLLLAALLLAAPLAGCAHTEPESQAPLRAGDFYPLALGNAWTYKMKPTPPGAPDQRTITIRERGPDGSFLTDAGMRLSKTDARVLDGQRVLLEEPLEVGHQWVVIPTAADVERYEIVEVGARAQVIGGVFKGCVRVRIEQDVRGPRGEKGRLIGVWTYAPGLGPVHFKQSLVVEGKGARPTAEYELVRFDAGRAAEPAEGDGR